MSSTITQTTTYSDARARHVMDKVFEDFTAIIVRGYASQASIERWKDDLLYLMSEHVLVYFEIQFTKPNGEVSAIRYYVKADNSVSQDALSGSLNLYGLPSGTTAGLFVHMDTSHPNYQRVNHEVHTNRGFGYGNHAEGTMEKQHAYSKEGYGVERNKIGTW